MPHVPQENSFSLRIKVLLIITTLSVILVLATAYTKFIFAKEYYFLVESPCDSDTDICFVRDCEEYCPPNGFAEYRTYQIKAADFSNCSDNTCSNICQDAQTQNLCTEIICDSEAGEDCS